MVMVFFICLGFVIAFIIALLHRLIIVPIQRLTRAARAIAKGDMTEDIPASKSRDEVGELTNAFREMQQSLRQCYYRPTEASEE
jgi:nitrogen fixation/metabolism regulation signal transduction histidine kinase